MWVYRLYGGPTTVIRNKWSVGGTGKVLRTFMGCSFGVKGWGGALLAKSFDMCLVSAIDENC